MLKIGVVGCGLQAASIAGYMGVYGDAYEVTAVMDPDRENAMARCRQKNVKLAVDCAFYDSLDKFILNAGELDGIIIGTYCSCHTDVACALEKLGIPIYMEKPVAITGEQLRRLYRTFKDSGTSVTVSLPMRLCPLTQRAKRIIDDGMLGRICQVVGYEDTPGEIYFSTWFRDADKTGGMFMQKAVHDIDYMFYLVNSRPAEVCAMRAKLYHDGDKPYELSCDKCPDASSCPEGPMMKFYRSGLYNSFDEAMKNSSVTVTPDGMITKKKYCVFSKDIKIEDIGECIIRMENGVHITHTQNFIVHRNACRRGARICGTEATLELDFNNSRLKLMSHVNGNVEEYSVDKGALSHYGGDRELVLDFLKTMKSGIRGRSDLITADGVMSTLACLCARESADNSSFVKVHID